MAHAYLTFGVARGERADLSLITQVKTWTSRSTTNPELTTQEFDVTMDNVNFAPSRWSTSAPEPPRWSGTPVGGHKTGMTDNNMSARYVSTPRSLRPPS